MFVLASSLEDHDLAAGNVDKPDRNYSLIECDTNGNLRSKWGLTCVSGTDWAEKSLLLNKYHNSNTGPLFDWALNLCSFSNISRLFSS